MKKILLGCFVFTVFFNMSVCAQPQPAGDTKKATNVKIRITVGDTVLTATMNDSPTARDFISLLPLTLTLQDYAGTEKINYLPKKLSIDGASRGVDPSVGDISYYVPWGNLALFYNDFGNSYSNDLVLLGKLDSDIEIFKVDGSVKAMFELIRQN